MRSNFTRAARRAAPLENPGGTGDRDARLHDWLVALLNEHNVTLTAALQCRGFNLLDRQRLKHWQTGFYKQIETASELLLPPAPAAIQMERRTIPWRSRIADWQRKHRIADGDPMIAALDLVRIYLCNARKIEDSPEAPPPSFEEFRAPSNCSTAARKRSSRRPPTSWLNCAVSGNPSSASIATVSDPAHAGCAGHLQRACSSVASYEPVTPLGHRGSIVAGRSGNTYRAISYTSQGSRIVVRLAGFTWTRDDFCRGWLITGDTGSGKTRSGITRCSSKSFRTSTHGADSASTTKGCIGRLFRKWRSTSAAKTI